MSDPRDPRRLLEKPDALSPNERTALMAGAHMRAPKGLADVVWKGFFPVIPGLEEGPSPGSVEPTPGPDTSSAISDAQAGAAPEASAVAGNSASSAAVGASGLSASAAPAVGTFKALASAGVLKFLVGGALGGAVVVGGMELARRPAVVVVDSSPRETGRGALGDHRSPPIPVTAAAPPSTVDNAAKENEPTTPVTSKAPSSPIRSTPSSGKLATHAALPSARTEVALVQLARSALRDGDARGALNHLEVAAIRFPEGVLAQEREVLTIEALAATGQSARASERARGYLAAHPESPFVERVRKVLVR